MEAFLKKQFEILLKLEKYQKKITKYMIKIGKWLLFVLPIILVVVTILTLILYPKLPEAIKFSEQTVEYQILYYISYYARFLFF